VSSSVEAVGGRLPLAGRTVVVTRASAQAGELADQLRAAGAAVVELATVEVADPPDGGAALAAAVARLDAYDWVVVTSPNGVGRLADALAAAGLAWPDGGTRLAVVGQGTATAATRRGLPVALVPERFVAEGLVEAFPTGAGDVLLAQAEAARRVVADGLRGRGWRVEEVVAYRVVPAEAAAERLREAGRADAITFASGSAVRSYVDTAGRDAVPAVVVCIGPVTADAARQAGLEVTAVAADHSLTGLVRATVEALS
jgi:uroporphyrinogen-III synthase